VAPPGTSLALAGGVSRRPLVRTEASAALCARYAACQRAAGLGGAEAGLVGGGSDASTTADAGVASIDGLGPRGDGFHTTGEHVELATLAPKAEALVRFLAGLRA
jgi:glutamate carboxypeptidase